MKHSFNQLVIVAVLITFLLMSVACLSLIGIGNLVETAHWVEHTRIVIDRLQILLSDVEEESIAKRSFVRIGDPAYLQSFQKTRQDATAQLQALKDLTLDNPARQSDLAQLQELLNQHTAALERYGQSGGPAPPPSIAQQIDDSNKLIDQIKARITAMQTGERLLLQQRAAQAQQSSTILKSIIIAGSFIGLIILLVNTLSLRREMAMRGQAEETLRRSEERMHLMIESVKDYAILMLDPAGRVMSWNSGAERIKGYRAEEIIGQHFSRFYPEDRIREGFPEKELQAARDKGHFENEGWRLRKDGSRFWASVVISAIRNAQGELLGFVKLTRDLTERRRAEQELLKSQQLFEGLFENSPDAIILVDQAGRIIRVNARVDVLFGYTRAELEGQGVETLIPERYRAGHGAHLAGYFAAPRTRPMGEGLELFAMRKDGSEFPVDIMLSPLQSDEGSRTLAVIRDITIRKAAEEALRLNEQELLKRQQMFEGLFENSPDTIILVNQAGRIVRVNTRAEALFGYTRAELEGQSVETLIPERHRARHGGQLAGYFAAPRIRETSAGLELFARRKDGSEFPADIMLSPLQTDEGSYALAVIRDITIRKEEEEHIQNLNEELKQRANLLEVANKELEAFSYSVSHDLRAPLRHIHGFVELLQKSPALQGDESGHRYMGVIAGAAKQMGRLIDDLLAFSRTGRAEMHPVRINMREMVDQVIRDLDLECRDRRVTWEIKPLPTTMGDPNLLRLVWVNLLDNALKYTRPRQEAKIEIGQMAGDGKDPAGGGREMVFYVRDNGVGFDMQYASKLFGVFQRLHRPEAFEGTGIGLANVQRIVHRHGGRVWAEGQVDSGATFYFSLPVIAIQPV